MRVSALKMGVVVVVAAESAEAVKVNPHPACFPKHEVVGAFAPPEKGQDKTAKGAECMGNIDYNRSLNDSATAALPLKVSDSTQLGWCHSLTTDTDLTLFGSQ